VHGRVTRSGAHGRPPSLCVSCAVDRPLGRFPSHWAAINCY
jgi:hypothetical protein